MKTPEEWSDTFHALNGKWFDDEGNDLVAPMFAACQRDAIHYTIEMIDTYAAGMEHRDADGARAIRDAMKTAREVLAKR